ncbi:MAG: glycosyltransferase family 4 protein [Aquabacterium sp.]
MSVVICNHGLRNSGGIERYLRTLVAALHELGVRPIVLAKKFDKALPEYQWVEAVKLGVEWAPRKLRDFAFDWRLVRAKRKGLPGPLIACNQTRAADIAICGSTHPGFLESMHTTANWLDRRKIALERAHFENARVVVAHSRLMQQQLQRFYGISSHRVEVLYPPVDMQRFHPVGDAQRRALRAGLGLPEDKAVFLLASTGHKRKGLDLLAEFFRKTDLPVLLVVAGRPISVKHANIRYLGYRSDIEDIYRAVDFTVMASSFEPFGLVGVESVLCGTPVLLAEGVGCAEVIRAPAGMTFSLSSPASFEDAMGRCVALWRTGLHRLSEPEACLTYNPSARQHVLDLVGIGQRCFPHWHAGVTSREAP